MPKGPVPANKKLNRAGNSSKRPQKKQQDDQTDAVEEMINTRTTQNDDQANASHLQPIQQVGADRYRASSLLGPISMDDDASLSSASASPNYFSFGGPLGQSASVFDDMGLARMYQSHN